MKHLSIFAAAGAITCLAGAASAQTAADLLLPPNAKPGECYARVYIPDTTTKVAQKVLVQEAAEELEATSPEFRWVEREVEVEGPSRELEIVPAVYEDRPTVVIIEPEHVIKETVPAEYETVEERVLVRQAYTEWKKGEGPIQRYDNATGEIMCLVTVPAEYETITKQVVKTPARVVEKVVPAKTETIMTKVMVEPPKVREVEIPAKFETVRVQEQVAPAEIARVEIPAKYETVYEVRNAGGGQMEWRPILCETNAKPGLIADLQKALRSQGLYTSQIDGVLGPGTMKAVDAFQARTGIARGELTLETFKRLGISVTDAGA